MGAAANDISGLAFDAAGGLFGYSKNGAADDSLVGVSTASGLATTVGAGFGFDSAGGVGGMAFDPDSSTMFLSDGSGLFTVDTATGLATSVGAHGAEGFSGISFIPAPGSAALLGLGLLATRRRR